MASTWRGIRDSVIVLVETGSHWSDTTFPAGTDASGDIFGGWVLSQMVIAAGTTAAQRAKGRSATVAINEMRFHAPVHVGDLFTVNTHIVKTGKTSMATLMSLLAGHSLTEVRRSVQHGHPQLTITDLLGSPLPNDLVNATSTSEGLIQLRKGSAASSAASNHVREIKEAFARIKPPVFTDRSNMGGSAYWFSVHKSVMIFSTWVPASLAVF